MRPDVATRAAVNDRSTSNSSDRSSTQLAPPFLPAEAGWGDRDGAYASAARHEFQKLGRLVNASDFDRR